jgi:hypothetical protein
MAHSSTHGKMLPKKGSPMRQTDEKYLARLQARYCKASKKERSEILDEFVKTTEYNRKYAIALLGDKCKRVKGPIRRPRRAQYGVEEAQALMVLWELFDGIYSKRLRAAMDVEMPRLYSNGFLQVSPEYYEKLLQISPATIDRLLKGHRPQVRKSRGFTKPGTLLKDRIPIRTWADWNEDRPGFCEMDLVDHSGGYIIRGADHAWTLCFTDIKTAWTECVAVRNKAQVHVFAAIQDARRRLPFSLLGIDSDNGAEFINDQLYRYCQKEEITFTRGRAGNKNDNAHVEQKNWSVVRRAVGYQRYDTPDQLDLLNRLYAVMHFYVNFFLPVAKLKEKSRTGSKVKKRHDDPQTPFARVLDSPDVCTEHKALLRETYQLLDLVQLRQQIDGLQDLLLDSVSMP